MFESCSTTETLLHFECLHLNNKKMTTEPPARSAAATTLFSWYSRVSLGDYRGGFVFSSPPSRQAEARPQAVQCLINSRRLDRGRRQNLQSI